MKRAIRRDELAISVRDYFTNGEFDDEFIFGESTSLDKMSTETFSPEAAEESPRAPTVRANVILRDSKGRFVSFRDCENDIYTAVSRIRPSHNADWVFIADPEEE